MSEDASATYRGFRNQALYALFRITTDPDATERVYRPEGSGDLAIYDRAMNLIEAVQVKDHTSDISLSHLKPKSPKGFFARLRQRRQDHPACTTKIATFGGLGPELSGAINNTTKSEREHRKKVVLKLAREGESKPVMLKRC